MIRDNREYRTIPLFETRKAEEGGAESYIVEGYASTFEPYVLFEEDGIQYKEQITPDAFKECDMSDVIFCKDHEGTVFARTRNNTLELSVDDKGLFTRTDLSKTASARAMFEEIQAGMYDQMSFAFIVREDDYDKKEHLRTIRKVEKLFDVSAVSFPANPGTDIGVATRDYFNGVIEIERAERLAKEEALREAKKKYMEERHHGN
jgi:HK97 family phage prohead protease